MTTEELASAALEALNLLGHAASSQPWQDLRKVEGDEALKKLLERAAKTWIDLLHRTLQGPNPGVFPRPVDAERALQQVVALLPSCSMDDEEAVARIRACARQALDSLGFPPAE